VNATICVAGSPLAGPPEAIIDTDFNTIGDDGQVGAMAAQLYAQGVRPQREINGETKKYRIS
jgi:predicted regulator of Ras-like GTPase activity (Roadblock/LC7/MglB family)